MEQLGDGATASLRETLNEKGERVITLDGELDISNVEIVEGQLRPLLGNGAAPVFDLSALTFMDSSGIAMLLRAAERTGAITIRKPSRVVQQIIDSAGLGEILRVES
jgi:anti-sigma B factor antagonist